ncbi:MAG: hypothetical protein UX39_C0003G0019 [Candidatus Magasanikbacteria bacterium GW2011_GWA2_46_17]|uniref:SHS2 domain-containing protein n=2 Tax=Parcubacteria group TaxID=1794811 RepID=A0A0G1S1W2_9BACT|nr:MAG: hypothetical protein UX39_C0003G0019 [Candidatus Magasanikbacteria bacterium GW2011_GWA2_46_17]OGG60994.1 MAG: hypothetical protein A3C86_04575 [Candidatus Kaiserbacteria bacterium RIFCSPHIGHO2_02_FULL_49_16]
MFTLPFAHKREKVIAIADIASDSVGACIAIVRDGAPSSIICAERSSLTYDEKSPEQEITTILSLIEEVGAKVTRMYSKLQGTAGSIGFIPDPARGPVVGLRPISSVHAIIHAPFATSQTARADASYETDELITDSVIGKLAATALGNRDQQDKSRIFEACVSSVELNEYRTGKPIGKRARRVSVATLISECEPELRAKITDSARKGFGIQHPILHSDIRALLLGTDTSPSRADIHLTVDMSGNSTNCVVIHKDTAAEQMVVPEGVRTIFKRIVGNGMPEEKLSLMRMISRNACSTPACEELNVALSRVEPELVKIFGETFSKFVSAHRLPNHLVLIVAPDFAPWISNFFSRIDFSQFTVTARQFDVHTLTAEDMRDSVAGNLGPKVDAWLSLGVALASSQEQSTG